jgi:signal transduction histidine kinase
MEWMGWVVAVAALLAATLLYTRLRAERAANAQLSDEHAEAIAEIDTLQAAQARLLPAAELAGLGQLAANVGREVESPLGFARGNVEVVGELLADYRKLVKNYDAAVQYCLQPVEMIFGADKAALDQLIKHVEEARRRLFVARGNLEKSALFAESKELLADAAAGLGRSSMIAQSLRRFTRPDSDGLEAVDINETIDAVLSLVESDWRNRIEVVREYAELPKVRCMPAQISRVFLHLANNAGQAIENTGRLVVQTRALGARSIEASFSDTGTGIADDVLPRIFEPFYSTKPLATGLGLAAARDIVKAHGGSISVRTTPGGGASFVVTLPIEAAAGSGGG